jgi:hypothetical protein
VFSVFYGISFLCHWLFISAYFYAYRRRQTAMTKRKNFLKQSISIAKPLNDVEDKNNEQICVLAQVTGADKVKFWLSRKDRMKLSA